jgi:hypothetical protein
VTELRDPSGVPGAGDWRRPDLFRPDDRRWFVAGDVDVWSLYVAGDSAFTAEVRATAVTSCEVVTPSDGLVIED